MIYWDPVGTFKQALLLFVSAFRTRAGSQDNHSFQHALCCLDECGCLWINVLWVNATVSGVWSSLGQEVHEPYLAVSLSTLDR